MATEEALKIDNAVEPVSDPETKRERSTIDFPYLDLDDAVQVAKSVHSVGGTSCLIEQLGAQLKMVVNGGGFRLRLQTARMFGLITYDRSSVTLTPLGQRVCDQRQEAAGRVDAFLVVPLYSRIYEQFKGCVLPGNPGLENAMVGLGVSLKQKDKARQVFQRSAQQANFFAHGNDRLVVPSVRPEGSVAPKSIKPRSDDPAHKGGGGSGSGGGGEYHPFIQGLLMELPPPKSEWSLAERRKWLQAAAITFNMIYTDPEDGAGTLKIEIEKDSA